MTSRPLWCHDLIHLFSVKKNKRYHKSNEFQIRFGTRATTGIGPSNVTLNFRMKSSPALAFTILNGATCNYTLNKKNMQSRINKFT